MRPEVGREKGDQAVNAAQGGRVLEDKKKGKRKINREGAKTRREKGGNIE
jgi:hypothetical protein